MIINVVFVLCHLSTSQPPFSKNIDFRGWQCSKMDAWDISVVLLVLTLVPSSHQWTSHGSIQFLSEGESTSLEAPGDSSAGCWWLFNHSDGLQSCCFASHPHLCDRTAGNTSKCRRTEDAKVLTEVDGVPGCTLSLRNLTEAVDKGNYQAGFPPGLGNVLDVSLWIFARPDSVDEPAEENHPGSKSKI